MQITEIKVTYKGSVKVQAGWRSIEITALAEKISDKRCRIMQVIDIDGEGNTGYASRTGANRQKYNVGYWARGEEGKIKNLSSLTVIDK